LVFVADDGIHGRELWKTDGTADGTVMVKDINPGPGGAFSPIPADPTQSRLLPNLTNVNGTLFFIADDGVHGAELWKSDGTEAGTVLVKDINPGSASTFSIFYRPALTNVNGTLFFAASTPATGIELWKSDGTEAGTVLVKDIYPGSGSGLSQSPEIVASGGVAYFTAFTPATGFELWKTDGTPAGTVLVKDIRPGPADSFVRNLTDVNGTLFFTADDGSHGGQLWKSDGTAAGTVLVLNLAPSPFGVQLVDFVALNGTLYFSASSVSSPFFRLYKSDGTAAGTVLVDPDLSPGIGSVAAVNGTLFFRYSNALWKTDGTAAGTVMLASVFADQFTDVAGTLFFTEDTNNLWKSDGTEAGTVLVRGDLRGIGPLTAVGGSVFFTVQDDAVGVELWHSDGTAAGTALVRDINTHTQGSYPAGLTALNGDLYFSASGDLWKTDGTAAGTVRLTDAASGGPFDRVGSSIVTLNGTVYFSTTYDLWKSDGTSAGTALLKTIGTPGRTDSVYGLVSLNGALYFVADDGIHGRELWTSDGTAEGTVLLKDINPGPSHSDPRSLTLVNGTVFFTASDPVHGNELWKTDGTEAGTVLVKDVNPGSASGLPFYVVSPLAGVNGTLFFAADDGVHGLELWKSDGTEAGTVLVKDVNPGRSGSIDYFNPQLIDVNGTLFFVANDGVHGNELWKSDGTADGTVLVKDINPGSADSSIQYLTALNGVLYFAADDGIHGIELWRSDGTADGTQLVIDIRPNGSGFPMNIIAADGMLYFSGHDGVNGRELWRSDGTADGTVMIADVNPGPGNSSPDHLTWVDGKLFFTADDGSHGVELWVWAPSPAVTSVLVNDGSAQRSLVTGLTVTFSTTVALDADAFVVQRQDGNLAGVTFTTAVVDGHTVAVLAFTGDDVLAGSLADGNYVLTVRADRVHDGLGQGLDADATSAFFRYFGDSNGDRSVDDTDLALFQAALGTSAGDPGYLAYFDYNGDGVIDALDQAAFLKRLGTHLDPP
jgi:ELWxxDGT repeat protein